MTGTEVGNARGCRRGRFPFLARPVQPHTRTSAAFCLFSQAARCRPVSRQTRQGPRRAPFSRGWPTVPLAVLSDAHPGRRDCAALGTSASLAKFEDAEADGRLEVRKPLTFAKLHTEPMLPGGRACGSVRCATREAHGCWDDHCPDTVSSGFWRMLIEYASSPCQAVTRTLGLGPPMDLGIQGPVCRDGISRVVAAMLSR